MPKIVDHAQYRKELLRKCFDLFAQKGYAAITTRELAKGLGVSTGTLYYYFPRKEELFEQMVEEISQQYLLEIAQELEGKQTLTERLEVLGNFLTRNEQDIAKHLCILVDFCQQQGIEAVRNNAALINDRQKGAQFWTEFLEDSDPVLIDFVDAYVQGVMLKRLAGDPISIADQIDLLGTLLTSYLKKD